MSAPTTCLVVRSAPAPLALALALALWVILAAPLAVAATPVTPGEPPVSKAASAQAADAIVSLLYESKPQQIGGDALSADPAKETAVPDEDRASGACSPTGRRPAADALTFCQPDDGNRIDVFFQPGAPGDVPYLDIQQVGTGHTATIHFEGSSLSAVVRQGGASHDALLRQSGTGLAADALQHGTSHVAELRQEGTDLRIALRQQGDTNASSIRQQGSGLVADVVQEGTGHSSTVVQQGSGNSAAVHQSASAATGRR